MTKIAFVCTGNSCRSQMAEGFARHLAKPGVEIFSAGVSPIGVNPRTIAVMKDAGIDISSHRSKHVNELPKELDYVITVCGNAARECPQLPARIERIHWDIEDPLVQGEEKQIQDDFRRIRENIRQQVVKFLEERKLLKK